MEVMKHLIKSISLVLLLVLFTSGCVDNKMVFGENVLGNLKIPGTNIDYNIMYIEDYNDFNENDIKDKLLFQYKKDLVLTSNNNVMLGRIWGHNVKNLSANPLIADKSHERFEQLLSFSDIEFAKKNNYFIYTTDKNMKFVIFGVGYIPSYYNFYTTNVDKIRLNGFIENIRNYSLFDYDIDVNENDKIMMLTTCTRAFGNRKDINFAVVGRLLRDNEKINNISIKNNDDYEHVENY